MADVVFQTYAPEVPSPGNAATIPENAGGGGGGAPAPDFFVDSVGGNDGNSGTSAGQAFQTLAALKTAVDANGNGTIVQMAGNSRWREALDFGLLTNITCAWDGVGTPPIIDGFDLHPSGWINDLVLTNLWYKDIAHNGTGSNRQTVLQDGALMLRALTAAAANLATGSYFSADASTANPIRVYINPGANPNSDGKVYEVCSRLYGINAIGDGVTLEGLVARGAMNNNGCIEVKTGAIVRRCVAAFGTKHNTLIAGGLMEDVVHYDNDARSATEASCIQTVAFTADATGLDVTWRRCLFYQKHANTSDIYAHTLNDPTDRYNTLNIDQCIAFHDTGSSGTAFGGGCNVQNITKSCMYGTVMDDISVFSGQLNVSHVYGINGGDLQNYTLGGNSSWSQVAFYRSFNGGSKPILGLDGSFTLAADHVSLAALDAYFGNAVNLTAGSTGTITLNASIDMANNALNVPGTTVYGASNNNTYVQPTGGIGPFATYHGTGRNLASAMAAWRTDTGQDANSIALTVSPFTGVLANGDFRVNGTILAGSGCTEHWDYNSRAIVAGPPERWPVIPVTFAQALTYITDPDAWDFYP